MTSRERLVRAIELKNPDRIPLWPRVNQSAWIKYGTALEDLLRRYPIDMGFSGRRPRAAPQAEPTRAWTDDWGCRWTSQRAGYFGFVVEHPLADSRAMSSYRFPDYAEPKHDQRFERIVKAGRDPSRYRIVGGTTEYGVLWYRMQWLRGIRNAMIDVAEDGPFVRELLDAVLESRLSYLRRVLDSDADAVTFGDDWGTQDALMIRPDVWRRLFKPAYKQLFDAVHEAGKHVFFETDGCTTDILGDWVEIGDDALSVQLNVVGIENAGQRRGEVCFWSDPDRQEILPLGTPQVVEEHIAHIVRALGDSSGGLLGCLYVDDGVPMENLEAALDTFVRLGTYGD